MKKHRPFIVQYLCIIALAVIGVMNIYESEWLRALTSAIYVFICVQVVWAGYRYGDIGNILNNLMQTNKALQEELDELYEQRDAAIREQHRFEGLSENNRRDSLRWRNEKNAIEKELNKVRQENRHLEAEIKRLTDR